MSRPPVWRLAVLVAALSVVFAPAADGAARLTIDGSPTGARNVTLLRIGDAWRGQLTMLVRSRQAVRRSAVLRVRYVPTDGQPLRVIGPKAASNAFVEAIRPKSVVPMRRGQVVPVAVRFTVPSGYRLSRIDGRLVADLLRKGRPTGVAATVQVHAVMAPARFEPSAVRLQVLRHCWLVIAACGNEADVMVRGDGVGSLARPGKPLGTAFLRNADGTSSRVQLMPDLQDGSVVRTADSVQATLVADDFSGVGKMHGDLMLNPAPARGPALAIDLTVGHSLALAILTVLLGAILGGWLVQRAGVRRKRRLLEIQLRSALERFESELHASGGVPMSYNLAPFLDPRPRHGGFTNRPFPGHRGAAALIWRIRTAQDDADFDEAIGATTDMVAKIERWIAIETVARATKELLDNQPPKRGSTRFSGCQSYRETELLLEQVNNEPGDDAQAEQTRAALAEEGALLSRWKVLWEVHRTLEEAKEADPAIKARLQEPAFSRRLSGTALKTVEKNVPARDTRTPDDVSKLRARLRQATTTVLDVMTDAGITQPYAVRQTLDEARELAKRLEDTANAPAIPRDERAPESVLNRQYLMQVLRDQLWTLGRAAVSSTAYALTIYDDTWGTPLDYATAFTTGFLTETIVNWAVMPALQSYNIRRAASQKETPDLRQQIVALMQQRLLAGAPAEDGAKPTQTTTTPP